MRKDSKNKGFTIIEGLATLFIFMIAVTGLIALQQVANNGAHRSKRVTSAVGVGSYFIAQLKSEIGGWKTGDDFSPSNYPVNQYPMLTQILGTGAGGVENWVALDEDTFRVDPYLGHSDLDELSDSASQFCVNFMLSPLETIDSDPTNESVMVWRARVRVSWPKEGQFQPNEGWKDCNPTSVHSRVVANSTDEAIELVAFVSREFSQ